MVHYEESDHRTFIDTLEREMHYAWGDTIHDNYGREKYWGLLALLEEKKIDSYTMLYVNDLFRGGSGGRVRDWRGRKVYQGGFRGFSTQVTNNLLKDKLGSTRYMYTHNLTYQISRAKMNDCSSIVLTFNDYNERLYRVIRDYHLPKVFGKDSFITYSEPQKFNGIDQWILEMYLK